MNGILGMDIYKVTGNGIGKTFTFYVEADNDVEARAAVRQWVSGSEIFSKFKTSAEKATENEIANANRILLARKVGE